MGDELGVFVCEEVIVTVDVHAHVSVKVVVGDSEGEPEADTVLVRVCVEEGIGENVMLGLTVGEKVDVDVKDGVIEFVVVNEGEILSECVGVHEVEGDTVVEILHVGVLVTEKV